MEQRAASKYVQISNTIFVPKEWPVRGMETFLRELAEIGISMIPFDGLIVVQVCNIPTKMVSRKENNETQYFFERVQSYELKKAYVIDIVFNKDDKNLVAELNPTDSGDLSSADNTHYSYKEISLDDYTIFTSQSKNRTAYYFIPAENEVQPSRPEPKTGGKIDEHSAATLAKRGTICFDILLFIAGIGLSSLFYIKMMSEIKFD